MQYCFEHCVGGFDRASAPALFRTRVAPVLLHNMAMYARIRIQLGCEGLRFPLVDVKSILLC